MSGFRDEFPLVPEPVEPEAWAKPPDRSLEQSLEEIRANLREVDALLTNLRRMNVTMANGAIVDILGVNLGETEVPSKTKRWDLVLDGESAGSMTLYAPKARAGLHNVGSMLAITNASFVPVADYWVIGTITSLVTPAIVISMVETWDSHPSVWKFDGSDLFVEASLPIWHFAATETDGSTLISEGVYGEKWVGDGILDLYTTLATPPSTTLNREVPYLR
jgi:hypothetical protein